MFTTNNKIDTITGVVDSRFVILFTNSKKDSVIFTHFTDSAFLVNSIYLYKYPYNIMDSITYYIKKRKIVCNCR